MKRHGYIPKTQRAAYAEDMMAHGRTEEVTFQPQRTRTDLLLRIRETRKWLAANPGKTRAEMPEEIAGALTMAQHRGLATWRRIDGKTCWFVRVAPVEEA